MSGWLDALLGAVRSAGVSIPLGHGLNFMGGLRAAPNQSTRYVDVTLADSAVATANLAAEATGVGVPFVMRIAMTAGTPGTADDVAGPAAPFACRILDRWVDVSTPVLGSSLRVRDTAGGSGTALSGAITTNAIGEGLRANAGSISGASTLASGQIPQVRRSDRGVAGTVYLLCERT